MGEVLRAPWSPEVVAALNEYQRIGFLHPFTCGDCRDRLGTWHGNDPVQRRLVATEDGWRCPTCDYRQDWCHPFMADLEAWKSMDPLSQLRAGIGSHNDAQPTAADGSGIESWRTPGGEQ